MDLALEIAVWLRMCRGIIHGGSLKQPAVEGAEQRDGKRGRESPISGVPALVVYTRPECLVARFEGLAVGYGSGGEAGTRVCCS